MAFFLIQYDRRAGELLSLREYASRDEAYTRRRELELAKEDHIEVVVLEGGSLEDIKRTHSRYFSRWRNSSTSWRADRAKIATLSCAPNVPCLRDQPEDEAGRAVTTF